MSGRIERSETPPEKVEQKEVKAQAQDPFLSERMPAPLETTGTVEATEASKHPEHMSMEENIRAFSTRLDGFLKKLNDPDKDGMTWKDKCQRDEPETWAKLDKHAKETVLSHFSSEIVNDSKQNSIAMLAALTEVAEKSKRA